MFLLVQCYDAMDQLHVRVRMVDDSPDGTPMTAVLHMVEQCHRPPEIKNERDVLAWLGEELIEMAHSDSPLL